MKYIGLAIHICSDDVSLFLKVCFFLPRDFLYSKNMLKYITSSCSFNLGTTFLQHSFP